jgi:hypothetical protein
MNIIEKHDSQIVELYHKMHPELNPDEIMKYVKSFSEKHVIDIPCVMHNNSKNKRIQTTVSKAMSYVDQRQPIITGNGTFVKQHAELTAPTVKMLESLQHKRGVKKNAMLDCAEGSIEYKLKYTGQLNVKIVMNAEYGGAGTPLSPFYNQYVPAATTASAKALTTTLICCLELCSGNTNVWIQMNISQLYDFIHVILSNTEDRPNIIIDDSVTPKMVMKYLSKKVHDFTFEDSVYLNKYLETLTTEQLSRLMYAFNVKYALRKLVSSEVKQVMDYIKANMIDIENMSEDTIHRMGAGTKIPEDIMIPMTRIIDVVMDNCIYPYLIDDNEVRCDYMKRCIVCVTDTDSLMVHFSSFLQYLFVDDIPSFRDKCLCASAFGRMLYVENVIPKFVQYQALNCNIKDKYYRDKFIFKNEFLFLAMTLYSKKMYAMSTLIQEGKPRNPHKISFTGLSFKKRDSAQFLEPVMRELYDKYILTGSKIQPEKIYESYMFYQNKLMKELSETTAYFKQGSVKPAESYKKAIPAQVRGALIWNTLYPDEKMQTLDRVYVVPLSWDLMDEYSQNDPKVAALLQLCMKGNEKRKSDPYISIPESYKTLPPFIAKCVNKQFAIDKILSPYKQIAGLFDFVMPETYGAQTMSRLIAL